MDSDVAKALNESFNDLFEPITVSEIEETEPTTEAVTCRFIKKIVVIDHDTGGGVAIEIWKDPQSGSIFGIDASFVDQVSDEIPSPFNPDTMLSLPEDEVENE